MLYLILLLTLSTTYITAEEYTAAVVEFAPANGENNGADAVKRNLNEYIHYMQVARDSNVDIIVFPEYGITGLVDDPANVSIHIPEVGASPPYNNEVLETLANAAQAQNMYIVFNVAEKATDAKNKTIYYNTNVVFDKNRKIVAKYRKINLYEEPYFTPGDPEENQRVTFKTDFGVTFGTFICFDMAFMNPSRSVLSNSVTDIVYPTAWYSSLPFYHSLSFQHGYALENKVNLLAANINYGVDGMGGSGIYSADGTVNAYYLSGAANSNKLLISNVSTSAFKTRSFPTVRGFDIIDGGSENDLDHFNISRIFDSSAFTFKSIKVTEKANISEEICDGSFCCTFEITVANSSKAYYKLMAYRGLMPFSPSIKHSVKVCSLLACQSDDPNTCALRNITEFAHFSSITIKSNVIDSSDDYYVPITFNKHFLPVFNTTYKSEVTNGTRRLNFNTGKQESDVMVFGIFSNSGVNISSSSCLSVMLIMTVLKYFL